MRQFRRRSLLMRTAAQRKCPGSFARRILAAYATSPFPCIKPARRSAMPRGAVSFAAERAIVSLTSP